MARANPTQDKKRDKKRDKHGICPLCQREVTLTFHHLTPKKLHRRKFYRKRMDRLERNRGIAICRLCHDGIHDIYDESTLGKHFNSLEKLQQDAALQRHFAWVARQKIA